MKLKYSSMVRIPSWFLSITPKSSLVGHGKAISAWQNSFYNQKKKDTVKILNSFFKNVTSQASTSFQVNPKSPFPLQKSKMT